MRSVTTLSVERMFSTLQRKHGFITLQSFGRDYPQMVVETLKKLLPTNVRGWVHPDAYKKHYYQTPLNGQLNEEAATWIYDCLTQDAIKNKKERERIEKYDQKEVQQLRQLANEHTHAKQTRLRQTSSKFHAGVNPASTWVYREITIDEEF